MRSNSTQACIKLPTWRGLDVDVALTRGTHMSAYLSPLLSLPPLLSLTGASRLIPAGARGHGQWGHLLVAIAARTAGPCRDKAPPLGGGERRP